MINLKDNTSDYTENISKEPIRDLIKNFINKYCIKTRNDENSAYVELMMDNHNYIEFEKEGYYLPEEISTMTKDEELTHIIISNTFNT